MKNKKKQKKAKKKAKNAKILKAKKITSAHNEQVIFRQEHDVILSNWALFNDETLSARIVSDEEGCAGDCDAALVLVALNYLNRWLASTEMSSCKLNVRERFGNIKLK